MAHNLKKVAENTGMVYDTKRVLLYGAYQGYTVSVKEITDRREYVIMIPAKIEDEAVMQSARQFLSGLNQTFKIVKSATYQDNSLVVVLKITAKAIKNVTIVQDVLEQMISFCKSNHLYTCCQYCGDTSNVSVISIDGNPNILCDNCYHGVTENAEEVRKQIKSKRGNIFAGIVGALLGSLIGAALWVIIYQLGYIAGIAGFVMVICALKGYEKFSGKLDIVGLIISLVVSVLMLFLAENISLAIEVKTVFSEYYDFSFFEAFKLVPEFMKEPGVGSAVLYDLLVGYALMAVASVGSIISTFRQVNHIFEIKNLNQTTENNPTL